MPADAVRPTLHHVTLKTTRLREMIEWYGLMIGMSPHHVGEHGAWLTNDAANHRLALLLAPGVAEDPDKIRHAGLHHTAYEYPSVHDLLDTYERVAPQGIVPHACLDHGMTTSFYYVDPDQNSLELQADNFGGDWEQSSRFLHTPEFAADPIGRAIDPERMVAARRQGADADELHRRAYAGEFEPAEPLDLRLPPGP